MASQGFRSTTQRQTGFNYRPTYSSSYNGSKTNRNFTFHGFFETGFRRFFGNPTKTMRYCVLPENKSGTLLYAFCSSLRVLLTFFFCLTSLIFSVQSAHKYSRAQIVPQVFLLAKLYQITIARCR